ncbi:MAG TPA: FecR family protein [Pyrinomonadaceae bacterium]|nr:FecR family protein [Pyrinomonadaceae bacterium]
MRRAFSLPASLFLSFVLIICCSIVIFAQNREKFVISAKAGGINAITGQADVHGRGESDWQRLSITDDLESGDRVRTEYDGRVEILLNPGSYLRLGGNSEVELSDNTLANIEVRLLRGTAIVEAAGADDIDLNINISTPHAKLAIVRQGLYRLNVVPEDATELIVRKGRVILGDTHTKIKGGNKVVFSATNVSVAKLTKEEKKKKEDVDFWSKQRGETLAKANRRIDNDMMVAALDSFGNRPFPSGRLGLWFYNGRIGCYTFLPYYYGFNSPYGSYSTYFHGGVPYGGYSWHNRPNGNGNQSGQPSGGNNSTTNNAPYSRPPQQNPNPPSGSYGSPGGMSRPSPRPVDSDTGRPMPRKNLERLPNQ